MNGIKNNFEEAIKEIQEFAQKLDEAISFNGDLVDEVRIQLKTDPHKIYPESEGHKEDIHGAIYEGVRDKDDGLVEKAISDLPKKEIDEIENKLIENFLTEFLDNKIKGDN